ncbi:MAG: glutaredoxin family protein [Actinomycetota bacterium]|nr:glutaredoxin family protein [Actinomycetota bacterium]
MRANRTFIVDFLTRPSCSLCERARPRVVAWAARVGGRVVERDVSADRELELGFGPRVPVVLVEGRVLAEGRISSWTVARRLVWERVRSLLR